MDDQPETDGRIARGVKSRRAIVEAHVELVRHGVLRPTAQEVADRAGVSVRTIWTNFADIEALLRATTARWMELDAEVWEPVDPALPMDERIDLFCARRAERIEHLAPAARSSALAEPFSPALTAARRLVMERLNHDLEHTFGGELGPRSEQGPVYDRLCIIAAWPVWQMLTEDLGLTRSQALHATTTSFRRVLAEHT